MEKKYQVIYSDPPWRYDFSKSNSRKIENQYPTMSIEELCNMKVPSDEDCVLYLWCTAPKLEDGLQLMKAWSFNYRSQAIWNKEKLGMGFWFRNQHEILLVGVKGNFSPPPERLRIGSVFNCKRYEHSKKPDFIREYIKKWYPDKNCLEMFARCKHDGWDAWGTKL